MAKPKQFGKPAGKLTPANDASIGAGPKPKPTHGVGGGVVSAKPKPKPITTPNSVPRRLAQSTPMNDASVGAGPKPKEAARGGRSSELHEPYIGAHGEKPSKLAAYLKRSVTAKPGRRVK